VEAGKSALHFATTAKKVQMRPVVNEVKNSKTVIARMQLEIQELRQQLVGLWGGLLRAATAGAQLPSAARQRRLARASCSAPCRAPALCEAPECADGPLRLPV
jgi:hypothetical protein